MRLGTLLLLILVIFAGYWLWQQPKTRNDVEQAKEAIVEGAAKVSNKIEDADIPEKTERAWDKTKAEVKETTSEIKDDFNDAKERDRHENH